MDWVDTQSVYASNCHKIMFDTHCKVCCDTNAQNHTRHGRMQSDSHIGVMHTKMRENWEQEGTGRCTMQKCVLFWGAQQSA